jgi:hypothetical protein
MRSRRCLAVVTAAVALVAACGDGDDGSGQAGPTTTAAATTTAAPTTTAPAPTDVCDFDGTTDSVTGPAEGEFFQLTAVRAARQPCFDRVVLEFREPGRPGYSVGYQPGPIVMDGSGDPVAVEGAAFLVIRVDRASGFDAGANMPSYTGPARIAPSDTVQVREVVRTGDFEGVLAWVVGVDQQRPFIVQVLSDPTRLVVDIG